MISALTTDFYELTMIQGYYKKNINPDVVFDMFYRTNPFNGSYSIFAGLGDLIEKLEKFKFSNEDLAYLKSLNIFDDDFLSYLKDFKFTGDVYAIKEGSVIFDNEPLIRFHCPLIQAQLIETMVLNTINFQTLIATKSSRIKIAAKDSTVFEFGLRRAQGDSHLNASRAAFIGGCDATSNTLAGKVYDIPVSGTMAHSWVMSFKDEYSAFKEFADLYPENTNFLLDTYDTLKSGIVNAIKIGKNLKSPFSVRLDSGDLSYLSKAIREKLDDNNLKDVKIVASNDLNEQIITHLVADGAPIDVWGVGTNLTTGGSQSALNGVYKMSCIYNDEEQALMPTMKISNTFEKTTNPGIKEVYRFYDENNLAIADYICLSDEEPSLNKEYTFYHPFIDGDFFIMNKTRAKKIKKLLNKVIQNGKSIVKKQSLKEIQAYVKEDLKTLHDSHKRIINPHIYKVSHSKALRKLKKNLILKYKK